MLSAEPSARAIECMLTCPAAAHGRGKPQPDDALARLRFGRIYRWPRPRACTANVKQRSLLSLAEATKLKAEHSELVQVIRQVRSMADRVASLAGAVAAAEHAQRNRAPRQQLLDERHDEVGPVSRGIALDQAAHRTTDKIGRAHV